MRSFDNQRSTGGGTIDASDIVSGTVATARLGSGTADNTTFLRGDSTWVTVAGSGTVTSVALTMPGVFSVAGSPVTTSGTLAVTLATQNANKVWAGPASGGDATPTFRVLVADDIPSLDAAKITTGDLDDARLSSNVPLLNAGNTFTSTNTFGGVTRFNAAINMGTANIANGTLYLYDDGAARYGLGLQSAQMRFFVDGSSSRYSFFDGRDGTEKVTIHAAGRLCVNAADTYTDSISGNTGRLRVVDNGMVLSFVDDSTNQGWLAVSNGTITGFVGHTNNSDGFVFGSYTNHQFTLRTNNTNRLRIAANGDTGFFGASPAAKPTVTGADNGNAAVASVLTGLAALGLVTNSSTAGMTTARLLGRTTAGTGATEEISVTAPLSLAAGALTTSMATGKLIGRSTASSGVMEEITVGSGLTLSAGTLTAAAEPTMDWPTTGSLTVATGKYRTIGRRLSLTSTERLTLTGTGRVRINN